MIPTAEEFCNDMRYVTYSLDEKLITFAKMHVEEALKQASEKATAGQEFIDMGGEFEDIPIYEAYVIKDSILKAYPLENIK